MPILTGHGQGCAVTKPSIAPATARAMMRPTAIVASERPAAARASPRERRPGATHAQKMCRPAAPATNMQVSSSRPCGRMNSRKTSPRSNASMTAAAVPTPTAFCTSTMIGHTPVTPNSTHCAAIQALFVHTVPANTAAGFSL
jgi:hypothetical protein